MLVLRLGLASSLGRMTVFVSLQKFIIRIVAALIALLLVAYIGDSLWFRVRMIHPKPSDPLESFTGQRVLAIPEKGNKTSYEIDQQNPEQTVTCAHSWFPPVGYRPCWYVKPRLNQPIRM